MGGAKRYPSPWLEVPKDVHLSAGMTATVNIEASH
jgi:hypothetical protein